MDATCRKYVAFEANVISNRDSVDRKFSERLDEEFDASLPILRRGTQMWLDSAQAR